MKTKYLYMYLIIVFEQTIIYSDKTETNSKLLLAIFQSLRSKFKTKKKQNREKEFVKTKNIRTE